MRQSSPSAIASAALAIRSFSPRAAATFSARSAFLASRCASMVVVIFSSRASRLARSPTAFASVTADRTFCTEAAASSGPTAPPEIRCSSRSTSNFSASYRSVKNFSASAGEPSGYCPTARSPSEVRT
ncbi:hypothetical protein QE405_001239 [Nocardioides zeae]|uniref:Secreted protein n=1 Tax=Nocardioides zeae TaxID=1457234 RepID=A0AAJ1TXS1_9ACTN|nr:hypothetical protein [Nocardioides zeae]